jgi:hypothetical protein
MSGLSAARAIAQIGSDFSGHTSSVVKRRCVPGAIPGFQEHQSERFIMNKIRVVLSRKGLLAVLASVGAVASANAAAIDVTAVVAGIGDAGTAILAVIAALLALSVSLFGLGKVYSFIKRKAGG